MKPKILIIDWEEELTQDICQLFERQDFEAVGINKADQALAFIQTNQVDLVCLEIILPVPETWDDDDCQFGKTTGIELVRQIKQIKPEIPIMAFTVIIDKEIKKRMKEVGFQVIINKPGTFKELHEAAINLLPKQ